MTSYEWPTTEDDMAKNAETTDIPAQAPPVDDDPLAALTMTVVPAVKPASPTALKWIQDAINAGSKRGRIPLTDNAMFETVRAALRRASDDFTNITVNDERWDGISVTCTAEHDAGDNLVGLTFVLGKRKGRKSE